MKPFVLLAAIVSTPEEMTVFLQGAQKLASPKDESEPAILPFANTPLTIPAGGSVEMRAFPQRVFRPEILKLNASGLLIESMNCSNFPQFDSSGAIDSALIQSVELRGNTLTPGQVFSMRVTNPTGVDVENFAPVLLGRGISER